MSNKIDTRKNIEAMIAAGFHEKTDFGKGMKADEYRVLWPSEIEIPDGNPRDRHDILLVDRTISIPDLCLAAKLTTEFDSQTYKDLIVCPESSKESEKFSRYIAFIQTKDNIFSTTLDRNVGLLHPCDVGLVVIEILQIPIQHKLLLQRHSSLGQFSIGVLGSTDSNKKSKLHLFLDGQKTVLEKVPYNHQGEVYPLVRGIRVIPVTCQKVETS